MKRFILAIFIVLNITSCGVSRKVEINDNTVAGSLYGYTQIITAVQLDSVCVVDMLPKDLNEWNSTSFYDYETNKRIIEWMYIKELGKEYEAIYILIPKTNTSYKLTKRIGRTD